MAIRGGVRAGVLSAFLLSTLVFASAGPAGAAPHANCFGPEDNARLPFAVFQQAPPPMGGAADWAHYPATAVATVRLDALNSYSGPLTTYYWQWANHGVRAIEKGNIAPGVPHADAPPIDFTSIAKADACTLAQTAHALGETAAGGAIARRAGLKTAHGVPGRAVADVCILPGALARSVAGIVLDYEVVDGRSPAEAARFLGAWADETHAAGRKAIFYSNPLNAPTQQRSGVDADVARQVLAAYDLVSVKLWSGNIEGDVGKSFDDQMALLGGAAPPSKILITFELNRTSIADAATARALITRHGLAGVMFWRNYAVQGGGCDEPVNQKMSTLLFGQSR